MAKWFPSEDETFVYVHPGTGKRVVVLIPGGEQPEAITFETSPLGVERYTLDEDKTEQTRMFVRVAERKRNGIE